MKRKEVSRPQTHAPVLGGAVTPDLAIVARAKTRVTDPL